MRTRAEVEARFQAHGVARPYDLDRLLGEARRRIAKLGASDRVTIENIVGDVRRDRLDFERGAGHV